MSKKVYARQVNPEFQGDFISDIFAYDEAFNNITVCGNDRLCCRQTEVFTRVYDALNSGDLAYYLDNIEDGYTPYTTVTEAINDYLYREDGKKYSCKDIHDLRKLVDEYSTCYNSEENDIICKVLSLVTRKEYDYASISGCCQGDWNEVFYPVDEYSRDDISTFEAYYFNTGSEWIIHDGDDIPESADDIDGYSMYCVTYDVQKEIAAAEGVNPEDVVLYEYHERQQSYYTVATA